MNKDNVLEVRRVILAAAEDAYDKLDKLRGELAISSPAKDKISSAAAATWNANLLTNADSHFNRLRQYVQNVADLGRQIEDAAKQYGYTEEEIAASFQINKDHG
ncbi:hypothetical protein [Saccharopolyspora erythraea]|uniref:hypothetical protein n=1 Tax=Saccharopolyspora erythraea TaxID=1836 RepID=UPI002012EE4D|nr:hypothetical protein [Saccharopolyspora erythraea]